MPSPTTLPTFLKAAVTAFPFAYRTFAEEAAKTLAPFVDDSYRTTSVKMSVLGSTISIPSRIHFVHFEQAHLDVRNGVSLAVQCLCSRSTDGHIRQAALRAIVGTNDAAIIPFVTILAGEYVVEITHDMIVALPALDRGLYANFVRENRAMMRKLRSKATSYWDCYYRTLYPDRGEYPGLAFLYEIERWAV